MYVLLLRHKSNNNTMQVAAMCVWGERGQRESCLYADVPFMA